MRSKSLASVTGLSLLILAAGAGPLWALMVAPPPMPVRVATADAVVVGTVTSIEARSVKAPQYPGDNTGAEYQVAVVKIDKALIGPQGLTHLRVGFVPPPPAPPPVQQDGGRLIIQPRRPFRAPTLEKGQEVCLFLMQHHSESFFIIPGVFDVVDARKDQAFKKALPEMEQAARLLADPMAGLRGKDARQRYLTAALLISRFRTPRPYTQAPTQEPIDAEQSRLIMQALADADWKARPGDFTQNMLNPLTTFYRLGVTPRDGFERPRNPQQMAEAAQQWVKSHVGTYRIKRFVAGKGGSE